MSDMYKDGFAFFPEENTGLIELIIIDEDRRANWFQPTTDTVRQACAEFDLDPDKALDIIANKDPFVHTLFINAPAYRGDKNG